MAMVLHALSGWYLNMVYALYVTVTTHDNINVPSCLADSTTIFLSRPYLLVQFQHTLIVLSALTKRPQRHQYPSPPYHLSPSTTPPPVPPSPSKEIPAASFSAITIAANLESFTSGTHHTSNATHHPFTATVSSPRNRQDGHTCKYQSAGPVSTAI